MSSLASLPSFIPQQPSPESAQPVTSSCRISCLPPPPTIPFAGISQSEQRYLYFGVRRGFVSGVYTDWKEAQKQIVVSNAGPSSGESYPEFRLCIRTTQNLR